VIGSLVPRVLDDLGLGAASRVVQIAEHWEAAVGREIASHSKPCALRGEILEVAVESSAWSQELKLREPQILAGLRSALGSEAPCALMLRIG
jgi:predicted nucleic acid-binding Zn ribbon protein